MNDLNKLTMNPLITLHIIEKRIRVREASDTTLEHAQELRTLLIEAINSLKPTTETSFSTSSA